MHVIRHYAPCVYAISNPIEVSQCFRHLTGYDRLREKATTGAGIQLLFDLFAEELFESSFFERRQIPASSFAVATMFVRSNSNFRSTDCGSESARRNVTK